MDGSFITIKIHRLIPIIAGSVQVPNNLEGNKNAVTIDAALAAAPSAQVTRLSGGTGGASTAGMKFGEQEFIELPGVATDAVDTTYNAIRALV